jgi:hypothetical protein
MGTRGGPGVGRREPEPWDTWRPQSCPEPGGGSRSHGDTWHPRSYPNPGSGSRALGHTGTRARIIFCLVLKLVRGVPGP